ncbi:hypothetical protein [Paenibacillus sp. FSL E2-0178]|uniref:helix-turn-helix domain-containing protein n=1 Tax=Paenibacillus sp. FSL E2-0178 TaxID=2921361 RepID=UPI0031585871
MEKAGYGEATYVYNLQNAKFKVSIDADDFPTIEQIGDRLQKLMAYKGFTIKDLAAHIVYYEFGPSEFGVKKFDVMFISDVINNAVDPPSKFVVAASNFFRVNCDWLLTGREYVTSPISKSTLEQQQKELTDYIFQQLKKLDE